jgi:hypothetical protein
VAGNRVERVPVRRILSMRPMRARVSDGDSGFDSVRRSRDAQHAMRPGLSRFFMRKLWNGPLTGAWAEATVGPALHVRSECGEHLVSDGGAKGKAPVLRPLLDAQAVFVQTLEEVEGRPNELEATGEIRAPVIGVGVILKTI